MTGKLYGVGVGPGDPELITLKAMRLMEECQVIAVPGRSIEESVAYNIARGAYPKIVDKELVHIPTPMTKDIDELEAGYRKAAQKLETLLDQGKNIALLTLGDPAVYSTTIYIHRFVLADGYKSEIVSGVTSFCAAAAVLGDSLVDRDMELHIIPASYQIEEALKLKGTKVFMKAGSRLGQVRELLLEAGSQALMIENCGMEDETVYRDVKEFPEKGSYYSIIIAK